jgi:hypothetical protein
MMLTSMPALPNTRLSPGLTAPASPRFEGSLGEQSARRHFLAPAAFDRSNALLALPDLLAML